MLGVRQFHVAGDAPYSAAMGFSQPLTAPIFLKIQQKNFRDAVLLKTCGNWKQGNFLRLMIRSLVVLQQLLARE